MPADFPAWGRVYAFFRRLREHGLIAELHDRLRGRVRERKGRETEPTAGIIGAQSVRAAATVPAASRGYDGGGPLADTARAARRVSAPGPRPPGVRRRSAADSAHPGCTGVDAPHRSDIPLPALPRAAPARSGGGPPGCRRPR
ncbi:transposase [Streptomyces inhibens]|uniref:transposase n=1 Tax=Streptomyces inhibens TaxID=2293571 RepID=UPI00378AB82E